MATYATAATNYITVGDTTFAYRQLGTASGTPLVMLMHFRGTMDHWEPAVIDRLTPHRLIILIDNAGVGRSGGEIPLTIAGWARHYIDVILALGHKTVDVLGFSMGGAAAQMVALNAPGLGLTVRKLLLCGTGPSIGPGVVRAELGPYNALRRAGSEEEHKAAFLSSFFSASAASQAAGRASWERLRTSRADKSGFVDSAGAKRQGIAFASFMDPKRAAEGSFDRFAELDMPVLIVNGAEDLLLPTENSILMWKMLKSKGAQLHLYPDSGHGFFYQFPGPFADLVNAFLDQGLPASRL